MTHTTRPHLGATLAGVAIAATGGYLAWTHTGEPDMRVLIVAMTAGAAYGAYMLPALRRRSLGLAALALLGVLGAEAYGAVQAVERVLAYREGQMLTARAENGARDMAVSRVAAARAELADAVSAEGVERGKGGCGQKCRSLATATTEARTRLATAEQALATTAPARAESLVAEAAGLPPLAVAIGSALLVSVALLALQLSLLGYGHGTHAPTLTPEVSAATAAKGKRKPHAKAATPKPPRKPRAAKARPPPALPDNIVRLMPKASRPSNDNHVAVPPAA